MDNLALTVVQHCRFACERAAHIGIMMGAAGYEPDFFHIETSRFDPWAALKYRVQTDDGARTVSFGIEPAKNVVALSVYIDDEAGNHRSPSWDLSEDLNGAIEAAKHFIRTGELP